MPCKYRVVVSIDGGGIRGVVPLKMLSHLQDSISAIDPEVDPSSWVDVFSGSSTGSIISGALMLRDKNGRALHNPSTMLDLYIQRGPQIFSRNIGVNPQHSTYPFSFILDHFFGNVTLDMLSKHFLFVSYDLNSDSQFLFTDTSDRFRDISLAKMMNACSAFPGVYPPVQLGDLLLADGMVAAKNPALMAYEYAKIFYPGDPIVLLSFGTGTVEGVKPDIVENEMMLIDEQLSQEAKKNKNLIYFRFQPAIHNNFCDFEEPTKEIIEDLIQDTESYIQENYLNYEKLMVLMRVKMEQMY
jgi:patatin-like phospholipase/acyl hydrolase